VTNNDELDDDAEEGDLNRHWRSMPQNDPQNVPEVLGRTR
jgi:hypothetical protein